MASNSEPSRIRILSSAAVAFADTDVEEVSIDEVARRAGVTRKTVYNLFGSRQGLVEAVLASVEADDAAFRSVLAAEGDAVDLLKTVLRSSQAWCLANPRLARLALVPETRPGLEPPAGRASFQCLILDTLLLGQKQGTIRVDQDARLLALMVLAIFGQLMLNQLASRDHRETISVDQLVRLCLEGIGR